MATAVLVFIHVLAATIWIGAHIVLLVGPLRVALKSGDSKLVFEFEKNYGRLAMASLVVAAATGIHMALERYPPTEWFNIGSPSGVIGLKVATFLAVIATALHAMTRVIPAMRKGEAALKSMAAHVAIVTALSILFIALGVMLRFGLAI